MSGRLNQLITRRRESWRLPLASGNCPNLRLFTNLRASATGGDGYVGHNASVISIATASTQNL